MKRFLTILLATLALTAALCVTASASTFDGAAAELAAIGMLKGGANGFDLDKVPTRAQAAIMLVRLYGAEEEAKAAYAAGDLKCPFTDVNETAAPYVAWLKDKGLASGTGADTFGAANPCTAKAYTIFLLRALGYKDGEDFTAANAQEFAARLGLVDTSPVNAQKSDGKWIVDGTFRRDDLAALTYQALATDMKGGGTYLLASLIKSGAVDADAARPTTEKIENYRAVAAAVSPLWEGFDARFSIDLSGTYAAFATPEAAQPIRQEEAPQETLEGTFKLLTGASPQAALDVMISDGSGSWNAKAWLRDGWEYFQDSDDAQKLKLDDTLRLILETVRREKPSAVSLLFADSIVKKASGDEVTYTVEAKDGIVPMVCCILSQARGMFGVYNERDFWVFQSHEAFRSQPITCSFVTEDGVLKKLYGGVSYIRWARKSSVGWETNGTAADVRIDLAAGGAVKIDFPDFSGFHE